MFENIIGNNENKKNLSDIIKSNKISHSYIFSGIDGIGKKLFAIEFAKACLCTNDGIKPCNKCQSCENIENFNHPDLIIIDEELNSIKTEQIKELTKSVLEKPIYSTKKVYIINNSENMTKEAQNSLLKTLEEPPEYIIVILIANNENVLLNTIRSRCINIHFKELSNNEIMEYFIKNNLTINEKLLSAFSGSIGKALIVKEKEELLNVTNTLITDIDKLNELDILKCKEKIFKEKEDINYIFDYMIYLFQQKFLNEPDNILYYIKCIKSIENTKNRLKSNSNFDMTIDNLLFEIGGNTGKNG